MSAKAAPGAKTESDPRSVTDRATDGRLEAVTRLACRTLDIPIAVVSLGGVGRQWFPAVRGITTTSAALSAPWCAWAMQSDSPLVIADTTADSRTSQHTLVTGDTHVGSCAARSMKLSGQKWSGTLAVMDHEPRTFGRHDLEALEDLTRWAADELTLTSLARAQKELARELEDTRRESLVDPMLHIWNRAAVLDLLGRELHRAVRTGTPLGLVLIDIDGFKKLNTHHGPEIGDTVLGHLAKLIRANVRPYDALGRFGGDEFLLVLGHAGRAHTLAAAERLRLLVEKTVIPTSGGDLRPTVTLAAVSTESRRGAPLPRLIDAVATTLKQAQSQGPNRSVLS